MTDTTTRDDADTGSRDTTESWWKSTWPLGKTELLQLVGSLVGVIAAYVAVGELLTNLSLFQGVVDYDERLAEDLAAGRTDTKNSIAKWSSFVSDTPVKIAASAAIAGFFMWRLKRWREAVMIGLPLIFEAIAYITSSTIVQRPRPDVERLLESPVDTSFPSGHVAAATVYVALLFIVLWHTKSVALRIMAVALAIVVPGMVAWARLYQGMHFLSDVVAGVVLGLVSVLICRFVLRAPADANTVIVDDRVPAEEDAW